MKKLFLSMVCALSALVNPVEAQYRYGGPNGSGVCVERAVPRTSQPNPTFAPAFQPQVRNNPTFDRLFNPPIRNNPIVNRPFNPSANHPIYAPHVNTPVRQERIYRQSPIVQQRSRDCVQPTRNVYRQNYGHSSHRGRTIIRYGEDVSHQTHRFNTYFPDHDWGAYRNRWNPGDNSIYFNNGWVGVYISDSPVHRVYSPWTNECNFISESEGRRTLEELFESEGIQYIKDVKLNLASPDNRYVTRVDYMVDINGWVPVEYVPAEHVFTSYIKNKNIYDCNHSTRFILIPPSVSASDLESRVMEGLRENGY